LLNNLPAFKPVFLCYAGWGMKCLARARFLGKIRAEHSEVWRFSPKPRSGQTLLGRHKHVITFACKAQEYRLPCVFLKEMVCMKKGEVV
jgi:hypothetical protein